MKKATLQKPLPCVPLTVAAALARPAKPIMPAGSAMVMVPAAVDFRNERRLSVIRSNVGRLWLPWRSHMEHLLLCFPLTGVTAVEDNRVMHGRVAYRGATDMPDAIGRVIVRLSRAIVSPDRHDPCVVGTPRR